MDKHLCGHLFDNKQERTDYIQLTCTLVALVFFLLVYFSTLLAWGKIWGSQCCPLCLWRMNQIICIALITLHFSLCVDWGLATTRPTWQCKQCGKPHNWSHFHAACELALAASINLKLNCWSCHVLLSLDNSLPDLKDKFSPHEFEKARALTKFLSCQSSCWTFWIAGR